MRGLAETGGLGMLSSASRPGVIYTESGFAWGGGGWGGCEAHRGGHEEWGRFMPTKCAEVRRGQSIKRGGRVGGAGISRR